MVKKKNIYLSSLLFKSKDVKVQGPPQLHSKVESRLDSKGPVSKQQQTTPTTNKSNSLEWSVFEAVLWRLFAL